MPRSCSLRHRRIRRIRPFPVSSSRRSGSPISAPCWPLAVPGRRRTRRSGRPTSSSSKASRGGGSPAEALSTRPTAGASSAGAAAIRTPMSVIDGRPLSNTTGSVLDPDLQPQAAGPPRGRARARASSSPRWSARRAKPPSRWPTSIATPRRSSGRSRWPGHRRRFSSTTSGSARTRPACSRILRAGSSTRTRRFGLRRRCCAQNASGPTALWAHGISGDLPIVLVRIDEPEDRGIVRQLLRAHEYWRMKGLAVDLVILNERAHSYTEELQASLEALVRTSQSATRHERHEAHGQGLHPAEGPAHGARARCPAGGRARHPPEPTRARSRSSSRAPLPPPSPAAPARRRPARAQSPRRRAAGRAPSSSSSTASAGSSTTAGST